MFCFQLKKQFPTMNLKIPAKRIFGDNFDPGMSSSCYSFCQFLYVKIDPFQPTRSCLIWVLEQSSKQWLNQSLVMLRSRAGTSVGRCFTLWYEQSIAWSPSASLAPKAIAPPSPPIFRILILNCQVWSLSPIKAKAKPQALPKLYA